MPTIMEQLKNSYKWSNEDKCIFEKVLEINCRHVKDNEITKMPIETQDDLDKLDKMLNDLLTKTADKVLVRKKRNKPNKQKHKWFNKTLQEMKQELLNLGKTLKRKENNKEANHLRLNTYINLKLIS